MKTDSFTTTIIGIALIVFAVTTGCNLATQESQTTQEIPEDMSLPDFLLGSWTTEHVYLPNGNESVFRFDVTFKNRDTIEVVVFENSKPTDITVSRYAFIDLSTIFVDNKRISGGETWHLERNGQKLLVVLEINDGREGITLVLVRKN